MSTARFLRWIPAALIVLAGHAPGAFAQSGSPSLDQLHAQAIQSFREARFPEAYGRFIELANAGHAPAAELALWMYLHGPAVFGRDWDCTQERLTAWALLAQLPVPTLVAQHYPRTPLKAAGQGR